MAFGEPQTVSPSMVYKECKPQASAGIAFTALAAMPALVEDSLTAAAPPT
jgi:hypothetical protein